MFKSCHKQEIYLFSEVSWLTVGPTQAPAELIEVALPTGITARAGDWPFTLRSASINTLPSGHAEMLDCHPMRCWWVMYFCVFSHDIQHMHLWADLAHFSLQGYQLDAGCWISSYKQTGGSWPPILRTIRLQQRDHLFKYSLFSFSCNHGFT
jgi:hypothetical protein